MARKLAEESAVLLKNDDRSLPLKRTRGSSIAVLGPPMARELDVSDVVLYGSFTGGLFVSGIVSPWVGRRIDRDGGRAVLAGGSLLGALACLLLASAVVPQATSLGCKRGRLMR